MDYHSIDAACGFTGSGPTEFPGACEPTNSVSNLLGSALGAVLTDSGANPAIS
jgi:hypothetical protein